MRPQRSHPSGFLSGRVPLRRAGEARASLELHYEQFPGIALAARSDGTPETGFAQVPSPSQPAPHRQTAGSQKPFGTYGRQAAGFKEKCGGS